MDLTFFPARIIMIVEKYIVAAFIAVIVLVGKRGRELLSAANPYLGHDPGERLAVFVGNCPLASWRRAGDSSAVRRFDIGSRNECSCWNDCILTRLLMILASAVEFMEVG